MAEEQPDAVMVALDRLIGTLHTARADIDKALERAEALRHLRNSGHTYSEAVRDEDRPLVVEIMRSTVAGLVEAAGRFQRAEARALRDEGLTMDRIATLFGISRQRVSDLLGPTGRDAKRNG